MAEWSTVILAALATAGWVAFVLERDRRLTAEGRRWAGPSARRLATRKADAEAAAIEQLQQREIAVATEQVLLLAKQSGRPLTREEASAEARRLLGIRNGTVPHA